MRTRVCAVAWTVALGVAGAINAEAAIPVSERIALSLIYNSTGGSSWTNNTNWGVGDACDWHGVTCDAAKTTVTMLNLSNNNLVGTLPAELGNLPSLQLLVLSSNQLTGSIPATIGNLTALRQLDLSSNQMLGALPATLGNLTNLYYAYLGSNQFTGAIPSSLGSLTHVRELDLSNSELTGPIPAELGSLTSVQTLDLSGNELEGAIPPSLGNLASLTTLDLSSNNLTGAIPTELGNLANLQQLYLGWNQLTALSPALGNLADLQYLDVRCNKLTGPIPATLGSLTHLEWLILPWNELTGPIPSSLGNLASLQFLYLDKNQLTSLPASLGNLASIIEIDISANKLAGPIPASLGNLAALQSLNLSENKLSGAIPTTLGNLASLGSLELSSNQLTGAIPTTLGNLANLGGLDLSSNQLTGAIPTTLGSLTDLVNLDLSSNKLTGAIPAILGSLVNLGNLSLSSNQLSETIPTSLASLANLRYLYLSSNQLTGAIPSNLSSLTNLNALELASNQLTGPIPSSLGSLANLWILDLSSNQLTGTIPDSLGSLTNMYELRLGDNRLVGPVPTALTNVTRLGRLELQSNRLKGALPATLVNLTSLYGLDLRWNGLYSPSSEVTTFVNPLQPDWQNTQTVPPTGLIAFPATATSLMLTWAPVDYTADGGGYEIFCRVTVGGLYTLAATTSSKSVSTATVTGLTPGTGYDCYLETVTPAHAHNANAISSQSTAPKAATTYALEPVQFSAVSYAASEGAAQATITVKRSGTPTGSVTVDYATADGSAKSGVDYQARAGTLTFASGVTAKTLTIPMINDTLDEPNETVLLRLLNPTGTTLGPIESATLTIKDNDAGGGVQFTAATYSIGESSGSATITVARSGGQAGNVTVPFYAASGSAGAGDFTPVSGTLTFGPGQMAASFSVSITPDAAVEGVETVLLSLNVPSGGATLGARYGAMLKILDDERAIELGVPSLAVTEGGQAALAVKRTGSLAGTVTVHYATSNGTASAGTDYTARDGTLTFGPNVANRNIAVPTTNDTLNESAKTFTVALDSPTGGAGLGRQTAAIVTINDNDPGGVVQFAPASMTVAEQGNATLTVKRTGGTASAVTVGYATGGGTATADSDYTATSGTLSFGANQATRTFTVPIAADTDPESAETMTITLGPVAGGATLGAAKVATVTIQDNDCPRFQFSSPTYSVGEGAGKATITVKRVGSLTQSAQVFYDTRGGTADSRTDYSPVRDYLQFAPGVASKTFTVPILEDLLDEGDETVGFELLTASDGHALGSPAETVLTIKDNDSAGTVQFGAPAFSQVEEVDDTVALITVTRSGGLARGAEIDYATSDGTATAGPDYGAASGTLSFAPGQASATFLIEVYADSLAEGNERVDLTLQNPSGGITLGAQATASLWIVEPAGAAKLVFIHHSTGENWLADTNGQLGATLRNNNYFVSDTNYGWGPASAEDPGTTIGDHTDIGHWWTWFRGPNSATYLDSAIERLGLYHDFSQHSSYTRLAEDPDLARENEIVVFKSCFPNSNLSGPVIPVPPIGSNPLRGQDASSDAMTVANAKGIYIDLLTYFAAHTDKLFIVVTAPPLAAAETSPEAAANARAFNDWLVNDWLTGYAQNNVAVFDFYNVLTSNNGTANQNDLGKEAGNHHRWWNGAIQHVHPVARDTSAYPTSDSHPSAAGGKKASAEFITLLNYHYNRWKGLPIVPGFRAGRSTPAKALERRGADDFAPPGPRAD